MSIRSKSSSKGSSKGSSKSSRRNATAMVSAGRMVPIGMGDEMYEELEPSQYLDLSHREMGTEGVLSLLSEMAGDGVVRQLRLSYNILAEELDPLPAEYFIRTLKKKLIKHRTLTALDLAGNHLFRNHPHPSNEHTRNYQVELTKALTSSAISHLDLSDNNMTGTHSHRHCSHRSHFQFLTSSLPPCLSCLTETFFSHQLYRALVHTQATPAAS
jgi:hypothetical protein